MERTTQLRARGLSQRFLGLYVPAVLFSSLSTTTRERLRERKRKTAVLTRRHVLRLERHSRQPDPVLAYQRRRLQHTNNLVPLLVRQSIPKRKQTPFCSPRPPPTTAEREQTPTEDMETQLDELAQRLGVRDGFHNPSLLVEALTHPSWGRGLRNYEHLEYLGDRILNLATANMLYQRYPRLMPNGLQAALERYHGNNSLVRRAVELRLDVLLRWRPTPGMLSLNPKALADCYEAVLGALFQDQGLRTVEKFLERHMFSHAVDFASALEVQSPKVELWKLMNQEHRTPIRYKTSWSSTVSPHDHLFCVVAFDNQNTIVGKGFGATVRKAAHNAAQRALAQFYTSGEPLPGWPSAEQTQRDKMMRTLEAG